MFLSWNKGGSVNPQYDKDVDGNADGVNDDDDDDDNDDDDDDDADPFWFHTLSLLCDACCGFSHRNNYARIVLWLHAAARTQRQNGTRCNSLSECCCACSHSNTYAIVML